MQPAIFSQRDCVWKATIDTLRSFSTHGGLDVTKYLRHLLIDRDGVLNRWVPNGYVTSPNDLHLLPGVANAVRDLNTQGFGVIVISNQQCVGKGLLELSRLDEISRDLQSKIHAASGGQILDFFYCPHLKEEQCACRKPRPGLITQAQERYGFEPSSTFLVGDSYIDLVAAHAAGCRAILALSGIDRERYLRGDLPEPKPEFVAADLAEAAAYILKREAEA